MVIRHSRYGTTSSFFAIGWALLSSTAAVGAAAAEPEARGGLELTALRVRLFADANGDGQYQEEEFSGIARVREAQGSGAVLLPISTLTFPRSLTRPFLLCEVDTEEGLHTQVISLR